MLIALMVIKIIIGWITPKDVNTQHPCFSMILIAPNLKVFNFSLVESQIQYDIILHYFNCEG